METRFPISRESGQVHISFVWYDAFRHSKKTEQCSIHFEKAAVLFNLAAILTQQALNADRATDAGRKEAAKFFQVCSHDSLLVTILWYFGKSSDHAVPYSKLRQCVYSYKACLHAVEDMWWKDSST